MKRKSFVLVLFTVLLLFCSCDSGGASTALLDKKLVPEEELFSSLAFAELLEIEPSRIFNAEVTNIENVRFEVELPEPYYDEEGNVVDEPTEVWIGTGKVISFMAWSHKTVSENGYDVWRGRFLMVEKYERDGVERKTPDRYFSDIELRDNLLIFDGERNERLTYVTDGQGNLIYTRNQISLWQFTPHEVVYLESYYE